MIKVPGQLHKSNALPLMRHSWRAVNPFGHFHSGGMMTRSVDATKDDIQYPFFWS